MASAKEISLKINKMKQNDENKKCFECGEKGTSYVCTNFGTFICSRCAGILRELNFKVKGIGLTIFNEKEMEVLEQNGNEAAKKIWLAKYKKGKDIAPSLDDDKQLKDFLSEKYIDKRWYKKHKKKNKDDDEDEEKNKKKKKKKKDESEDEDESDNDSDSEKAKKSKKNKKKKKKNESDEDDDQNSDSDEEDEDKKNSKKKKDDSSSSSSDDEDDEEENKKNKKKR